MKPIIPSLHVIIFIYKFFFLPEKIYIYSKNMLNWIKMVQDAMWSVWREFTGRRFTPTPWFVKTLCTPRYKYNYYWTKTGVIVRCNKSLWLEYMLHYIQPVWLLLPRTLYLYRQLFLITSHLHWLPRVVYLL